MGIFKYGEITPSGHPYLLKQASPDDSIYKNGVVIGGRYRRPVKVEPVDDPEEGPKDET